jgi:putative ABC transport system substrate-binding protein
LVRLHVDLMVTRGTPAAQAAKNATETIPIVMAAIGEPLGVGVVASLARPGGNVTGLSAFVTELAGKRVELVKELRSGSSTVALLHNMGNPGVPAQWEETKKAAKALGIEAVLLDVRSRDDIPRAFETANAQHVDTLLVGIEALIQENRQLITDLAAKHRLAAIYASKEFVDVGGLMTYGVSYPAPRRSSTRYSVAPSRGICPLNSRQSSSSSSTSRPPRHWVLQCRQRCSPAPMR